MVHKRKIVRINSVEIFIFSRDRQVDHWLAILFVITQRKLIVPICFLAVRDKETGNETTLNGCKVRKAKPNNVLRGKDIVLILFESVEEPAVVLVTEPDCSTAGLALNS